VAGAASLVGLWDGVYRVQADGSVGEPIPFVVLIDDANTVYLAAGDSSDRGTGTISASGDVLITVVGTASDTVTYTGHISGDSGSGTWRNTVSGHAGPWVVTRRPGGALPPGARATCEEIGPCTSDPDANPAQTRADCMFALAQPGPAIDLMLDRISACRPAATCELLWRCFAQGALDQVHVAPSGDDDRDGVTPAKAKKTLNAAINATRAGGTVLVAAGTYAENVLVTRPVTILGGFDADFSRVDSVASPVTLDGRGLDAVITVFTPTDSPHPLVLKGLRIVNGNSSGAFGGAGGGLRLGGPTAKQVVIEDCVFRGNRAAGNGGAIQAGDVSLSVSASAFEDNIAGGGAGGAIDTNRAVLTVSNCTFRANRAGEWGGAINTWQSQAAITGCTITGNTVGKGGGGISMGPSNAAKHSLKDTTVTDNTPNNIHGQYTDLGGNVVR